MAKIPPPSPSLNRLRAAAGLAPLVESGLSDGKIPMDRVERMLSFCREAVETADLSDPDCAKSAAEVSAAIDRLSALHRI